MKADCVAWYDGGGDYGRGHVHVELGAHQQPDQQQQHYSSSLFLSKSLKVDTDQTNTLLFTETMNFVVLKNWLYIQLLDMFTFTSTLLYYKNW